MNTVRTIAKTLDAKPSQVIKFLTDKGVYVVADQPLDAETEKLIVEQFDKSAQRLVRIENALRKWVADFEAEKVQFLHRLDQNPTAALERSTSLMFLSTRADAAKRLLDAIEVRRKDTSAQVLIGNIVESYQREAINAARSPRRSTNPISDYISAEQGRTAVEILDAVQFA